MRKEVTEGGKRWKKLRKKNTNPGVLGQSRIEVITIVGVGPIPAWREKCAMTSSARAGMASPSSSNRRLHSIPRSVGLLHTVLRRELGAILGALPGSSRKIRRGKIRMLLLLIRLRVDNAVLYSPPACGPCHVHSFSSGAAREHVLR